MICIILKKQASRPAGPSVISSETRWRIL